MAVHLERACEEIEPEDLFHITINILMVFEKVGNSRVEICCLALGTRHLFVVADVGRAAQSAHELKIPLGRVIK